MQKPLLAATKKDKKLEELLKQYNMLSLYDTFEKNSISIDVIWELEEEYLKEMGMSVGERILYLKAKGIRNADQVEGKFHALRSTFLSNFENLFLLTYLNIHFIFIFLSFHSLNSLHPNMFTQPTTTLLQ